MVNSNGRCIDELVLGFWRLLDWQITPQQCLSFLENAIEMGVSHTDHAVNTVVKPNLVKHLN